MACHQAADWTGPKGGVGQPSPNLNISKCHHIRNYVKISRLIFLSEPDNNISLRPNTLQLLIKAPEPFSFQFKQWISRSSITEFIDQRFSLLSQKESFLLRIDQQLFSLNVVTSGLRLIHSRGFLLLNFS